VTGDIGREQLLAEREELARTVQALAERFHVTSRARAAATAVRARGRRAWDRAMGSNLFIAAAAAAGATAAVVVARPWWRRLSGRVQPRS
jgi:hypothetical protein